MATERLKEMFGGEWAPIPGTRGKYFACKDGRIASRRCDKLKIKTQHYGNGGYKSCSIWKNGSRRAGRVHRLILEAFVGKCPRGCECDHINNIRDDNRLENLRWVTKHENLMARAERGTLARGSRQGASRFTEEQVSIMRKLHKYNKVSVSDLARLLKSNVSNIALITRRDSWKHVK